MKTTTDKTKPVDKVVPPQPRAPLSFNMDVRGGKVLIDVNDFLDLCDELRRQGLLAALENIDDALLRLTLVQAIQDQ